MAVRTGTTDTQTTHSMGAAVASVAVAVGLPACLAITGLVARGWGAISWAGAIIGGLVGTIAMLGTTAVASALRMTRIDLNDLLGSMLFEPGSDRAKNFGLMMHFVDGALLGVGFAFTMSLFGWSANWATGLGWGIFVWAMASVLLTSIGALHPAIRRGAEPDPGPAATHFGSMTPVISLVGHVLFGAALGWIYQFIA